MIRVREQHWLLLFNYKTTETTMSNLYEMFEMDKDLEREGITINYGSVKFLIARAGGRNKAFKTVFGAKTKKHRHQIDNETLTDDAADRIIIESYAEAVVLGWWSRKEDVSGDPILKKGEEQRVDTIENKDGKNVKFSVAECIKLFQDLPDLFANLQQMSQKSANYRKGLDEEDEGNLEVS